MYLRLGIASSLRPVLIVAFASLVLMVLPGLVEAEVPLAPSGAFTIVVLPDTQYYCASGDPAINAIFGEQTKWVADHKESHNILCVLHEGDVVHGDGLDLDQWDIARASMDILNGRVPYVIAPGNHDYEGNAVTRFSYFNDDRYFGPNSPHATQETVGGFFEDNKTDNSYHLFRVEDVDWLVLALQFGPPDEVVDWASGVVGAHPNHSVILVTHAYMYSDDTRHDWEAKGGSQGGNPHSYPIAHSPGETVNDGQQLWDELVKIHPNMRLVLSGHITNDGTGLLTSIGEQGQVVQQMLANYQTGVYGSTNGGNGFMRLIDIFPNGTINVRTYSPHVDEFLTTPDQQFTLEIAAQEGATPQELALLIGISGSSIETLQEGGFDLGLVMAEAVEKHGMARNLAERGYFHSAEWILEVKVLPVLEQLEEVPALLSDATSTINDAKASGIDNLTTWSLENCLASAKGSLDQSDVNGAKTYLQKIINVSAWQDIPSMLLLAPGVIKELEEAGDRRSFMAKGDYDRAVRALSRCDHEAAQAYLMKILALPEPVVPPIVALSLLAMAWHKRWLHLSPAE